MYNHIAKKFKINVLYNPFIVFISHSSHDGRSSSSKRKKKNEEHFRKEYFY